MAAPGGNATDEVQPSAPPAAWNSGNPPSYNAVSQHNQLYPTISRRDQLVESLRTAGGAVGNWFGVARNDHMEMAGWQRTGTLPRSEAVRSYAVVPQQDPDEYPPPRPPAVELGNRRSSDGETTDEPSAAAGGRGGRGRRGMNRLAATLTLQRRRARPATRAEVEKTRPKFWPVATVLVAITELALLTALLVQNGFAPISFNPTVVNDVIDGFGNYSEFVTRQDVPNFFIGPSGSSLIHAGAKYTPCMRDNVQFQVDAAQDRAEENSLRCCLGPPVNKPQCGMLPQGVCTVMYENGVVLGGKSVCEAEMNRTEYCEGGVVLHPCCVGLLGDCVVTTEENCTFQKGRWHPDKLLCSEVSTQCFDGICELTWSAPRLRPQQGVRFLSAIFLYEGIIHWILISLFKIPIMWKVETRISWLRVILIYALSGIGGYLVSGIFEATSLSVFVNRWEDQDHCLGCLEFYLWSCYRAGSGCVVPAQSFSNSASSSSSCWF